MSERHTVETTYRGARYSGEWFLEGAIVHLESAFGSRSRPFVGGRSIRPPAEVAVRMLWDLLREKDPKRPFFYWPFR